MNKVIEIGRLTKDADIRSTADGMSIARFTLAVDRRYKKDGDQAADFIPHIAFGKTAEFIEKYGRKGVKFAVEGRIQTGSYTNNDNQKVYTTDVVVENIEFAESKSNSDASSNPKSSTDDFMSIPDGIESELPFV